MTPGIKRALRITAYVFLALIVVVTNVVAGGLFYLRSNHARESLLAMGLRKLGPLFPGGVELRGSEGNLTRGLVLHDVVLHDLDGRPAVIVKRVELKYSLLALLLTRVQVDLVDVDGLTIISQPLGDGRDNLSTMANVKLPKPPRLLPVSVALRELNLQARLVRLPPHTSIDELPEDAPKDSDVRAHIYARAQLSHGMVASIDQLLVNVETPSRATLRVAGGVHIADKPDLRHVSLRLEGDTTELRRHVENLALSGPVLITAAANGPIDNLTASLAVDTHKPRARLRAKARVFADRAELDALNLTAPFATADAHGVYRFDQTGEGSVHVDASDLRPLALFGAPELAGTVKLDARVKRDLRHLVAHANGLVRNFRIAKDRIGRIAIKVDMADLAGHAVVNLDDLSLGAIRLRVAKVNVDGGAKGARLVAQAHGPEGLDLDLAVAAVPRTFQDHLLGIEASIERVRLRAGGTPWQEDHPAHVSADFGTRTYSLTPLGLSNHDQHVSLEGHLMGDTLEDANVDVKHFDLSQLTALLSPGHVLPHTDLQAQVEAHGALAQPEVAAKFEGTGDGRGQHDLIHFKVNGESKLMAGRLHGKFFATIGGQKISASADVPMPLAPNQPMDVSFNASVLLNPWFADILVPKAIQSQPILLYSLGAMVTAQASITGSTSDPKIHGSARVARWGAGNSHGDLALSVEYGARQLGTSGTLTFSSLPLGGGKGAGLVQATSALPIDLAPFFSGQSGGGLNRRAEWHATLNLKHVDIDRLPFEALDIVPVVRHGWVDATANLAGSSEHPRATVHVDARSLDVGGVTDVGLVGDAKLDGMATSADMKISVRGSEAMRVQGSLSGARWKNAALAATVDAPEFDLTRLQLFKELDGKIHGSAKITGSWTHPKMTAALGVTGLRSGQTQYQQLDLKASVNDGKLAASLIAVQSTGSSLTARVETPLSGGALSGAMTAKHFKVDLESDLLPIARLVRGDVDGTLQLAGTRDQPRMNGALNLSRGEVDLAGTAITYRELSAGFTFEKNGVAVSALRMKAGSKGTLEGEGRLTFSDARADSVTGKLTLRRYPLEWDTTTGEADAVLALEGHRDESGFTTRMTIEQGRVDLQDDHSIGGLLPTARLEDVKVAKARPEPVANPVDGKPRTGDNGKHYTVAVNGPFVIHGSELDVEARADLVVDFSSEIPTAKGELTMLPHGVVRLFGQSYDLERGRLRFTGAPRPSVDLRVARGVSKARIGIVLTGSSLQPRALFWSEPAVYAPANVASMVTGQARKKDSVVKKGIELKVSGPISNLIAVSFHQADPASKSVTLPAP